MILVAQTISKNGSNDRLKRSEKQAQTINWLTRKMDGDQTMRNEDWSWFWQGGSDEGENQRQMRQVRRLQAAADSSACGLVEY